jgi:hypothetical protein
MKTEKTMFLHFTNFLEISQKHNAFSKNFTMCKVSKLMYILHLNNKNKNVDVPVLPQPDHRQEGMMSSKPGGRFGMQPLELDLTLLLMRLIKSHRMSLL